MAIENLIVRWSGTVYRHIPVDSPYSVLDTRFADRSRVNRWNRFGEPTLYLTSDHAVLVGEVARHLQVDRDSAFGARLPARRIYHLTLCLDADVDLRDPRAWAALSLHEAPGCFLDRVVAPAGFLRATTPAEALLVPAMAFLDQSKRWVMAIFLEKLPAGIEGAVTAIEDRISGTVWRTPPAPRLLDAGGPRR